MYTARCAARSPPGGTIPHIACRFGVLRCFGIFQCACKCCAKVAFTAGKRCQTALAGGEIAGPQIQPTVLQAAVIEPLRNIVRRMVIRKQELDRLEAVASSGCESLLERQLGEQHSEIRCELRHRLAAEGEDRPQLVDLRFGQRANRSIRAATGTAWRFLPALRLRTPRLRATRRKRSAHDWPAAAPRASARARVSRRQAPRRRAGGTESSGSRPIFITKYAVNGGRQLAVSSPSMHDTAAEYVECR